MYRIVFLGTPDFAVPSLEILLRKGYDVVLAVTQPDRRKGRGGQISACEVKCFAEDREIRVITPENIREAQWIHLIQACRPDLLVTCAYGQILSQAILSIPRSGCVNVHASLLPRYRGAAPIHRAIMEGEIRTGITTMMTDRGMDTGNILLQRVEEILEDDDSGTLHNRLKHLGAQVLADTLDAMRNGTLQPVPQDHSCATYAPMLGREDEIIRWDRDAKAVHNQIRGMNPWPGCYTLYRGKKMKILRSEYGPEALDGVPGQIVAVREDCLVVSCKNGVLYIYDIQFENRCRISVFQCGHNLEKGIVLETRR